MSSDLAVRVLVTVGAALVLSLQSPPLNWHLLQWVGLLPMMWVVRAETPRTNRALGYLYGVVGVGALFRWLVDTIAIFSNLPTVAALGILGLFAGVFGAPYVLLWSSVHPMRARFGTWWVVAWPALWVVIEFACMVLFLFPYNHGVGQYRVPLTWQIVGVTGIWGLTFLIFFVNAVLAEWMFRLREGDVRPPGFAALGASASLLAVVAYGAYRYEAVEAGLRAARPVRMAQLQSHMGMEERMLLGGKAAFDEWTELTASIPPGAVDLVVWPEGASAYSLDEVAPRRVNRARKSLSDLAVHGGYDLIVGAGRSVEVDGRLTHYNSVFAFDAAGTVVGRYDKMIPLPFGEYFPFGSYFPGLADAIGGIGDFRAGTDASVLEVRGTRVAAPICYEAILPSVCRWFDDPDLFVNVTNDAWFGDTAAPHQHAMLAATRTTELGVPMVRSAYAGVSMVIEPHGVIHAETPVFERVQRRVVLRQRTFPTLYAWLGDWFVGLCVLGLGGAWLATRRPSG